MSALSDYLKSELDRALARLPDERAKVVFLARQYGSWTARMQRFTAFGEQPFGAPHPEHGLMTLWDFHFVLSMIDEAKREIERVAA